MDKSRRHPPQQADLELSSEFLDLPLKPGAPPEPSPQSLLESTADGARREADAAAEAVTELIEPTLVGRALEASPPPEPRPSQESPSQESPSQESPSQESPSQESPSIPQTEPPKRRPMIRRVSAEEAARKREQHAEITTDAPPEMPDAPADEPADKSGARLDLWVIFLFVLLPLAAAAGWFSRKAPPLPVLDTAMIDFEEVRIGTVGDAHRVGLQNQGASPLRVRRVAVHGTASPDFAILADGCAARELAPDAWCVMDLAFRPAVEGAREARLELLSDAPNDLQVVPLRGLGIVPRLRFEPEEMRFGERTVGYSSPVEKLWLTNRGSAPLALEQIDLEGRGAADFLSLADGCSTVTLPPGERCAIRWVFIPTAEGERRATVRVRSEGKTRGGPDLVGRGLPQEASLRLAPDRLEFLPRLLETASAAQSVTLTNVGTGQLVLSELRVDPPDSGFEIDAGTCARGALPAEGGKCTFEVLHRPRREGLQTAFLEILHDASGEGMHRLALVGTGTAPHVRVTPTGVHFNEVPLRQDASWRRVEVINSGTGELHVQEILVGGHDPEAFSVRESGCLGRRLAPEAQCRVEVAFRPERAGPYRADLVLQHSADTGFDRVSLVGIGVAAELDLDREKLDFASTRVGEEKAERLMVFNRGKAPLEVRSAAVVGENAGAFELRDDRCSRRSLSSGDHCSLSVVLRPSTVGALQAELVIEHSGGEKQRVPIRGRARAPARPGIEVSTGAQYFAVTFVGEQSESVSIPIYSRGDGPLVVENLRLIGPQADDFVLDRGNCRIGESITPGSSCRARVSFRPSAEGLRSATLLIAHNAEGGAVTIDLGGDGATPPAPVEEP